MRGTKRYRELMKSTPKENRGALLTNFAGLFSVQKHILMAKEFQITGWCNPEFHYMADISNKLAQVMLMVESGKYFIINRPRQYGKTTMLEHLVMRLGNSPEHVVFSLSFEGIGDLVFQDESVFSQSFIQLIARDVSNRDETLSDWIKKRAAGVRSLDELSAAISDVANHAGKKLVLLIDEVDKSSNNQLFVSFLGLLRNKYLRRHLKTDATFHAVVLAGVHDVKSLKLKIRPEAEAKYNSPWNIGAEFEVDMSLQPSEILPMLEEYMKDKGVKMDAPQMAERLIYYTSGYPFLVSRLCKSLDEKILPKKEECSWTLEDLALAVNMLTKETNTNFDTLAKNLENNPALYEMAYNILMEGEQSEFSMVVGVASGFTGVFVWRMKTALAKKK